MNGQQDGSVPGHTVHYSLNADTAGMASIGCDRDFWSVEGDRGSLDLLLRAVEAHERDMHR